MTAANDQCEPINCISCGKFISHSQLVECGGASFYFEPDNHFGPERSEWTCKACMEKQK